MIVVTTLKGEPLAINDQLIERVEDDNETRIILTSGARYIVAESVEEIVRRCRQDRAEVQAIARHLARRIEAAPPEPAGEEGEPAGGSPRKGHDPEENIVPFDRRSQQMEGPG